jgi:hypothetical protein
VSGAKVDVFTDAQIDAALFSQAKPYDENAMLIDIMGMGTAEQLPMARTIMRAAIQARYSSGDTTLLSLLADIRKAAGDSQGRLMQDELVARIAGMHAALRQFVGAQYPVATEIDPRGYAWSETYLDQALVIARNALSTQQDLALFQAPSPADDSAKGEAVERAAKAIYGLWNFGTWIPGTKPEWVTRGNSHAQELARDFAREAIAAAHPEADQASPDSVASQPFVEGQSAARQESAKWQVRRTSTTTGEWLKWLDCDDEAEARHFLDAYTSGGLVAELRALYAAPVAATQQAGEVAECGCCFGTGWIAYQSGQTPESFEQGEAPCPYCNPSGTRDYSSSATQEPDQLAERVSAEQAELDLIAIDGVRYQMKPERRLRMEAFIAQYVALSAEVERLREDAENYRWLRVDPAERDLLTNNWPWCVFIDRRDGVPTMFPAYGVNLDAMIKAARTQPAQDVGAVGGEG